MTQLEPESLLRALAEERVPPESPEALGARRERLVSELGSAIRNAREASRRRGVVRKVGVSLMAAASLALVAGYGLHLRNRQAVELRSTATDAAAAAELKDVSGTLVVTHAGVARVVSAGAPVRLSGGDEVRTPADGSALAQTERSAIRIHGATQVDFFSPSLVEERIRVATGSVDLKVSKQPHSRRSVVVETPNAEVVVRGTVFNVAVESEQGSPVTRVRVTEGAVWVLHAGERALVSTGEEWSSRAASQAAVATGTASGEGPLLAPSANAPAAISRGAGTARRVAASDRPAAAAVSSTLSEQNGMYQAALDARNQGDDRRALELFAALLGRYPGGHFAQDAEIERMRAFRRLGNSSAAAAEARRYLAENPSGYAREEARRFALGAE